MSSAAEGMELTAAAMEARPQDATLKRLELGGFDYAGRGYPLKAP